jgi:HlyD family secretion protein
VVRQRTARFHFGAGGKRKDADCISGLEWVLLNRRPSAASLKPVQKTIFWFAALILLAVCPTACRKETGPPSVSGTIETDEIHVASRYGGRVAGIFAWEGDVLTNGQLIAELEAPELRAQRNQAAAALEELIAGPRTQELAAARGDWESLVADLELARLEARRSRELFADKTLSESERDRAESRAAALEKAVAASRSRYDLLVAGTRSERIDQARARLAELDSQLRELRVVAPTNCVLEVLSVKIGDVLPPNREVATLILAGRLWVRVYVPQPWLGFVKVGQEVRAKVDAFPDREFEGGVEQVGRVAEFTPRNVQTPGERVKQVFGVKVRFTDDALRAGMSADVYFPGVSTPPR